MAISNLPANYSDQLPPKPLMTNTVIFLISARGVEVPAVADTAICTLISMYSVLYIITYNEPYHICTSVLGSVPRFN